MSPAIVKYQNIINQYWNFSIHVIFTIFLKVFKLLWNVYRYVIVIKQIKRFLVISFSISAKIKPYDSFKRTLSTLWIKYITFCEKFDYKNDSKAFSLSLPSDHVLSVNERKLDYIQNGSLSERILHVTFQISSHVAIPEFIKCDKNETFVKAVWDWSRYYKRSFQVMHRKGILHFKSVMWNLLLKCEEFYFLKAYIWAENYIYSNKRA